jgi:hypothetical protein
MGLGANANLITTATLNAIANNGTNDVISNDTTDNLATAFSFTNGNTGDDSIENFGKNDSILNYQKIFDGNGDGIIDFGPNGILDIDRTTKKNPGSDQITLQGMESKQLRYLGEKQGYYVYADASVKLAGFTEGTVKNDSFNAGTGSYKFFYDTALGLNLGGDTITGFGADDQLVTTTAIFNGAKGPGDLISFGKNGVLDLSGETANTQGDFGESTGGQIDLIGVGGIYLQSTEVVNGVTYYHYGLAAPTMEP